MRLFLKQIMWALLVLGFFSINAQAQEPIRVLFIGNSFTFYNRMPQMLSEIASVGGLRPIDVGSVTNGGATLQNHWEKGRAQQAIDSGHWDYVVLQEQTGLPRRNPSKMFRYAQLFDDQIKKMGAKTLLYLTWSDQGRPQLQAPVSQAYNTLATQLGAQLVPVGIAWQNALIRSPNLPLYIEDKHHPTPTGSYLAACTFYQVIEGGVSPCPAIHDAQITSENADIVRASVSDSVK
jgi:hypothetical protein